MTLTLFAGFALVCAAIPALMFLTNLNQFKPLSETEPTALAAGLDESTTSNDEPETCACGSRVSLLIPARNEADGITAALESALASVGVELEIIVLDDNSEDQTAAIVQAIASRDKRVSLNRSKPLPPDWNGKQHACFQLAQAAAFDRLLFIDADVRLTPDAVRRLLDHQDQTKAALLSAFPHQVTGTWSEKWLIPLMHYILLGFLPIARMRRSQNPAYAAGCGQLFLTRKLNYERVGTHAAIRASRHDGLALPRAYRIAGLSTDIVDGTSIAECRMYTSAPEVTRGLLKNAIEGIANPKRIVPFTIILIGGSVLPLATAIMSVPRADTTALGMSLLAIAFSHLPRAIAAIQFRQSWQGVIFHSLAITIFIALQWQALLNHLTGRRIPWRGRG